MDTLTFFGVVVGGMMIGCGAMLFALRHRIGATTKRKPARKRKPAKSSAWLTRHQLGVLDSIAKQGSNGILIWGGGRSLSTLRSLAKRGFVDTRSGGRIVATYRGRKRLRQPWPADQPTGDQKDRSGIAGIGYSGNRL